MTNREMKQLWRLPEGPDRDRLLRYIADIEDPLTRRVFELRYREHLYWEKVADLMGGMNTSSGIRSRVYRYFWKH